MKILLDTHCFIWFAEDDRRLSRKMKLSIESDSNDIFISMASLWEMAIKVSLKKLELRQPLEKVVDMISQNGFEILNIKPEHILIVSTLEFHHRDPFDRLIAAQTIYEKMMLVSQDDIFDKYCVKRLNQ